MLALPVLLALALGAPAGGPRLVIDVEPSADLRARASADGKYEDLIGTIEAPGDVALHGSFKDHGHASGGTHRGIPSLPPAYWVYVAPRWYLWARIAPRLSGELGPVYRHARESKLALGRMEDAEHLPSGAMLPVVRTSDGGFFFSAHRDGRTEEERQRKDAHGTPVYVSGRSVPLAVKLDPAGALQWERSFQKNGFVDYEFGDAIETPQRELIVSFRCYVHPGRSPVYRFAKLTSSGSTVWDVQLRGTGGTHTPAVLRARLTERGTLALEGIIHLPGGDGAANEWRGEISRDGKLLSDRVGPLRPPPRDGPVEFGPDSFSPAWLRQLIIRPRGPEVAAYRYLERRWLAIAEPRLSRGKGEGLMSPVIQLSGGGFLVVAVKDLRTDAERARRGPDGRPLQLAGTTAPVVLRLDAAGELVWERSLEAVGFPRHGGGEAIEAPDGSYLVMIPAYGPGPAWTLVPRFLALSRSGDVIWERRLPAERWTVVERTQLLPDGRLLSRGYTYAGQSFEAPLRWEGEIHPGGKLVEDVGGVRPQPGAKR